jgi:hypothetical protein
VENQGVINPQANPSATPSSANSATPQPQNDPNKPLYERTATDIPWARHSGSGNTTTTTTTVPPQQQQPQQP